MRKLKKLAVQALAIAVVTASSVLVAADDAHARKRHGARSAAPKQTPIATNASAASGMNQQANEQAAPQANRARRPQKDSGDAHLDYVVKKDGPNKDSGDAHLDY